jgi:transcriptional regulator with XRE-family HTH domain
MQRRLNHGMDTLAKRAKAARIHLKLNQAKVAEISGLKQADISKIENGKILRTTGIVGLAKALRCDPEWLLTGDNPPDWTTSDRSAVQQKQAASGTPLAAALRVMAPALDATDMITRSQIAHLFSLWAEGKSDSGQIAQRVDELFASPALPKESRDHLARFGNTVFFKVSSEEDDGTGDTLEEQERAARGH